MEIIDELYGELDAGLREERQGDPADGLDEVAATIRRNEKIEEVHIDSGAYIERSSNMGKVNWREYRIQAQTKDGQELKGFVLCIACGSIEDPYERYRLDTIIY